jgi:hypothetical protein
LRSISPNVASTSCEDGDGIRSSIPPVADGRSVLEREFGAEIDSFEAVGRISNYEITGFERFVGSRTDIWFNGVNQNLRQRKHVPARIVALIPERASKWLSEAAWKA